MNAQEAKKQAAANRKQAEENIKIRQDKAQHADVALLYTHFHNKIEDAVNAGRFTTEDIGFPLDRFSSAIIQDVAHKLKDEGFYLQMDKHNAFQKVNFKITW